MAGSESRGSGATALLQKHGQLTRHEWNGEDFYFRRPTAPEYKQFVSEIQNDSRDNMAAMRNLALACCVSHDRAALSTVFDSAPGFPLPIADRLQTLAGAESKGEVLKA